jgi:RND family efflux transporter MFP subunit
VTATRHFFPLLLLAACFASATRAQEDAVPVRVEQVREQQVERSLPLTGRVHSRHDASLSLTLAGELEWVLEPGTLVEKGEVIGQLDQQPILLRKAELSHIAEREQVNSAHLDKELKRLKRLKEDNNASERLVDEGESQRDISRLELKSLQARIAQLDDELRRSRLVAPFSGVIANRHKRGGEYVNPGEPIARLVDLQQLELRFQVPVSYLGRLRVSQQVPFSPQGGQLLGVTPAAYRSTVRTIIPAADSQSQTFEVRADIDRSDRGAVIAGQLVNVALRIASGQATVQIPRDAIVLRSEGNFVFRIDEDNTAQRVAVELGEGSTEWVSVKGEIRQGDWVAVRGLERLQDGQTVLRRES